MVTLLWIFQPCIMENVSLKIFPHSQLFTSNLQGLESQATKLVIKKKKNYEGNRLQEAFEDSLGYILALQDRCFIINSIDVYWVYHVDCERYKGSLKPHSTQCQMSQWSKGQARWDQVQWASPCVRCTFRVGWDFKDGLREHAHYFIPRT